MINLKKYGAVGYILLGIVIIGTLSYCFKGKLKNFEASKTIKSRNSKNDLNKDSDFEVRGKVINVETKLSVREEPDEESTVDASLYNGMTFDIINKQNDWYEIEHEETVGYVHEDYVEEYTESPSNEVYENQKTEESNLPIETEETNIQEKSEDSPGREIKAELTAYCNDPRCSEEYGSQTAMQTETRLGVVAAPKDIPLGSKLYIPELSNYKEDGIFNVEDRGGAIKVKEDGTYIIDIWLPSHEEVEAFGRKKTTIFLLE